MFKKLLLLSILTTGCIYNQNTSPQKQRTNTLNKSNYLKINGGVFATDPWILTYIEDVGRKVAQASDHPDQNYSFILINNSMPKIHSLSNSTIAIYRGLFPQFNNEATIAFLIAREMAHIVKKHRTGPKKNLLIKDAIVSLDALYQNNDHPEVLIPTQLLTAFDCVRTYPVYEESIADIYAVQCLAKAGYSKADALHCIDTLKAIGPFQNSRKEILQKHIEKASWSPKKENNFAFYQAKMHSIAPAYQYYEEAKKLSSEGKNDQALISVNMSLGAFPSETLFLMLKGSILQELNRLEEAEEVFSKVITLDDGLFEAYTHRAAVRTAFKNTYGAKQDLEKSISILDTVPAHSQLATIYLNEGRKEQAQKHLMMASLGSTNDAKESYKKLETLTKNTQAYSVKFFVKDPRHVLMQLTNLTKKPIDRVIVEIHENPKTPIEKTYSCMFPFLLASKEKKSCTITLTEHIKTSPQIKVKYVNLVTQ